MNHPHLSSAAAFVVALLTLAAAGCDLGTDPRQPTRIEIRPQTVSFDAIGDTRTLVAEVFDPGGALIEDAEVEWRSLNTAVVEVAPDGTITSRGNGTGTVRASSGSLSASRTISVQQAPHVLEVVQGDEQEGGAGTMLPVQLTVRVADRLGTPVPGVTVVFTVAEGNGTASPRSVPTDEGGIAATNWRLGMDAEAAQRVTVSVLGAARLSARFRATALPREIDPEAFDIQIEYLSAVSPAVRDAFQRGIQRWSEAIVEKLAPVTASIPAGSCGNEDAVIRDVDDLHVFVSVVGIDGRDGVLGQARICALRESGFPIVGLIRLDRDDVDQLENNGSLDFVVLHELGHALGIGSRLWTEFGLLRNPSIAAPGADTHFIGQRAIAAFDAAGGDGYTAGEKVPVENQGGEGTRDSHWRASVFEDELMVGSGQNASMLSRITLASLADLGYAVDEDVADPYTLPMARPPTAVIPRESAESVVLVDDVVEGPILVLDVRGRLVRIVGPGREE